jgi:Photosynthesis system II assembly factor YCF48
MEVRRVSGTAVLLLLSFLAACGGVTSTPSRTKATLTTPTRPEPPSTPQTTTLIPPGSSPQPEPLLQFVSSSTGWLIDPTKAGRILGTTDGGRNWWTSFNGPLSSQSAYGAVKNIDFVNESDGWALLYGRGLISTRDGGHRWSVPAEPTEGPIVTFTFTGRDSGWAITDQGALLQTLDSGRSWVTVKTPVPALTLCSSTSGPLWLGGDDGNIYVSPDGESWSLSFSYSKVAPPFATLSEAPQVGPWMACSGQSVWALYQWGEGAGSDPFVVERTLDGGENWEELGTPNGESLVPPNPQVAMNTPSDIGVIGATSAWILGYCGPCQTGSASVVVTSGGTTFSGSSLSTAPEVYASPIDVTFVGPLHGWAALREYPSSQAGSASAESTVILSTTDGGTTWKVVDRNVQG